jgi:hypothetical protein
MDVFLRLRDPTFRQFNLSHFVDGFFAWHTNPLLTKDKKLHQLAANLSIKTFFPR